MKLVGELACQRDGYLQKCVTEVTSCIEVDADHEWVKAAPGGSPEGKWYGVQLADTPLFPEGGGQPFDTGRIGEARCLNVQRKGMEVWHLCDKALSPGEKVEAEVDWDRRWDQMQQHTGQHVLTAVVEQELGLETMCWGMGKDTSYIQLPVAKLPQEDIDRVEQTCNRLIRDATPVEISVISDKEAIKEATTRSTRGIPEDITGAIRLIDIKGLDRSTCCGTHVQHLGHLQAIKLLHYEPKGNTLRLFFVVGDRVLRQSAAMYDRERKMVKALGTFPEDHLAAVERIQKSSAQLKKMHTALLKDMAPLTGDALASQIQSGKEGGDPAYFFHRDDADMPFLMTVQEKISAAHPTLLVILSQGDVKAGGDGQMLIAGPTERVQAAVAKVEELTGAKGGLNKGKWRGKIPDLKKLKALQKAGL